MFRDRKHIEFNKGKFTFHSIGTHFLNLIRSIHFRLFLLFLIIGIPAVYLMAFTDRYYYRQELVKSEVAKIQTKAAVIAADYKNCTTLNDAKNNGLYNDMVKYSTMNQVRIRIVNPNYEIESDSYSIETGKIILNSRVISSFNSNKSLSGFDKNSGAIEAVVPLINSKGTTMGIFVMDMDVSELMTFEKDVLDLTSVVRAAIITVLIALSLVFAKTFGKSFHKAFRTVEEIANGHTDRRLQLKGYTELRSFANEFNTIMDKNSTLDENRQEFVSNVSHELKTPITSIKVLADSLNMQEDVPIELYKEFMQDIANEIDRESKIIEDLLSLVRMDKSAAAINISSVNLNELLEIVLKRLKPIAKKKNIEILFESFRPVVAEVDEVKFTQVISNLVENAIKYNKIDGWVHVSLNADYQYFYVRVEDSGIGIPTDSQDMVFERFYRVDKARSRETGGTGLGLAIVKNIILMHHGTVKLHSEEGVGTTFTVRIPLNYVDRSEG